MHKNSGQKFTRKPTQKPDNLVSPEITAAQSKCHFVCAPFDRANELSDAKWGIDRLPGLVSSETAGKYGGAIGSLNEAMGALDAELVEQWAGVCIRGLAAMDAEAIKLGHTPASGEFIEIEVPEFNEMPAIKIGILKDARQREAAKAIRPDLTFITAREAATAYQVKLATPLVKQVKDLFPDAEVTKVKSLGAKFFADGGDDLADVLDDFIPEFEKANA